MGSSHQKRGQMKVVLDIGSSNGDSREEKMLEEKKKKDRGQKEDKPEKINEKEAEDGDEAQRADTPISGNCYHRCDVYTKLLCTHVSFRLVP